MNADLLAQFGVQFAQQQIPPLGQQQMPPPQRLGQGIANFLGGLWAHPTGLGSGGTSYSSWREKSGLAERRALKLFRAMYGWKAMVRYLRHGYMEVNVQDGRTYRVYRERHKPVEVYQRTTKGKKFLYRLCLADTEQIPLTDSVLKRVWMLRCDPKSLYEQANIL